VNNNISAFVYSFQHKHSSKRTFKLIITHVTANITFTLLIITFGLVLWF